MAGVRAASGKQRRELLLALFTGLVAIAVFVAVSFPDPDGAWLRTGMVFMTVGLAMWFGWRVLVPLAIVIWLVPAAARTLTTEWTALDPIYIVELPALVALALAAFVARGGRQAANEGAVAVHHAEVDPETGVYQESHLTPALSAELARSRRFNHAFALVLVGVGELQQRFDYRHEEWTPSFQATARLLGRTRNQIDRVYRYGERSFAMVLPESGPKEVVGLVRRLLRDARKAKPAAGKPGGPLPLHFGATFFPECATSVDDLLKRAEVALRLAAKSPDRLRLDGAEAPEMPAPETLRAGESDDAAAEPSEDLRQTKEPARAAGASMEAVEETEPAVAAHSGWEVPVEQRGLVFSLGPITRRPRLAFVPKDEEATEGGQPAAGLADARVSGGPPESAISLPAEEMARLLDLLRGLDAHLGAARRLIRDLKDERSGTDTLV